jgi:hypothetical protein
MPDLDPDEQRAVAKDYPESVSVTVRLRSGREIVVTADRDGVLPAIPEHPLNARATELLQQAVRFADEGTYEVRRAREAS